MCRWRTTGKVGTCGVALPLRGQGLLPGWRDELKGWRPGLGAQRLEFWSPKAGGTPKIGAQSLELKGWRPEPRAWSSKVGGQSLEPRLEGAQSPELGAKGWSPELGAAWSLKVGGQSLELKGWSPEPGGGQSLKGLEEDRAWSPKVGAQSLEGAWSPKVPLEARVAMTTAVRAVDAQGLSIATHQDLACLKKTPFCWVVDLKKGRKVPLERPIKGISRSKRKQNICTVG